MKRLTVLRHAKSSWKDRELDDFDRPLNGRGRRAARRMGQEINERRMHFDFVLASDGQSLSEVALSVRTHWGKSLTTIDPDTFNLLKPELRAATGDAR